MVQGWVLIDPTAFARRRRNPPIKRLAQLADHKDLKRVELRKAQERIVLAKNGLLMREGRGLAGHAALVEGLKGKEWFLIWFSQRRQAASGLSHMPTSLGLFATSGQTAVERVIAEFRSGRPVEIRGGGHAILALPVSALDRGMIASLEALADGHARLVLPAARLRHLGLDREVPGRLALPELDPSRLDTLALKIDAKIDAPVGLCDEIDRAALELGALALIPPAMILIPLAEEEAVPGLMAAQAADILAYRRHVAVKLDIVSRAPVPLEGAPKTEFVVFRGGEGLRDQVAIIVGNPDLTRPVPVRLHSACLTGDLFGSLKCDCGDQLRGTVQSMAESGGGILLYLDQEGRGNGLANKISAYRLQHDGYDTYDADEILGFGLDQRRFDFAAEMLRQLGVTRVALITNNPEKIAALRRADIDVVADQRAPGRHTAENVHYLASKRDKAGHFIDLDTLVLRSPVQD